MIPSTASSGMYKRLAPLISGRATGGIGFLGGGGLGGILFNYRHAMLNINHFLSTAEDKDKMNRKSFSELCKY